MTQTTRACTECGAEVKRTNPVGSIRAQCSDDCRRAHRRRTRPEQPTLAKPCDTCGTPIPRTKGLGSIPKYCSNDCRPRCASKVCNLAAVVHGLCQAHDKRARRGLDIDTPIGSL